MSLCRVRGRRSEGLWEIRRPPAVAASSIAIERWEPANLFDLTRCRRQLADTLDTLAHRVGADGGAVERLLLAFEEIGSNAVRHGRPPVDITLSMVATYWLLQVSDTAVERPPTPAVNRDASEGGLGLYLVAQICGGHGWYIDRGRKIAWARIDYTRAEAPPEVTSSLPKPRWAPEER